MEGDPYYYLEPLNFTSDEEFNDTKIKFWESLPPSLLKEPEDFSTNGQESESSVYSRSPKQPPRCSSTPLHHQGYLDNTQPDPCVPQDYLTQYQDYLDNTQQYPYVMPQDHLNEYQDYSQPDPYIVTVPQGFTVPYHDSSYMGYPDLSADCTYWVSDVYLHPNSQNSIQQYHTEPGTVASNAPKHIVMQRSEELGNLSASGCDQSGSSFFPEMLYPNVSPLLIPDSSPMTDYSSKSFPTTPEDLPLSSYIPFTDQTPATSPETKHGPHLFPLKGGRKSKRPFNPAKRRRSLRGRVRPQSQSWLDAVFCKGRCKYCKGGSRSNRQDRLLEHLVSSHFIQPIKDMEYYDRQELADEAEYRPHYIKTHAQFEYTRRFINSVKCSLCVKDTSLVFRDHNVLKHLETVHAKEDETTKEEELIRLMRLIPDKERWYSIHDKFLYEFPEY